jgi:hypothetical protein
MLCNDCRNIFLGKRTLASRHSHGDQHFIHKSTGKDFAIAAAEGFCRLCSMLWDQFSKTEQSRIREGRPEATDEAHIPGVPRRHSGRPPEYRIENRQNLGYFELKWGHITPGPNGPVNFADFQKTIMRSSVTIVKAKGQFFDLILCTVDG